MASAALDGHSVPYWAQAMPLNLVLAGVCVWLWFHFASLGDYREGDS